MLIVCGSRKQLAWRSTKKTVFHHSEFFCGFLTKYLALVKNIFHLANSLSNIRQFQRWTLVTRVRASHNIAGFDGWCYWWIYYCNWLEKYVAKFIVYTGKIKNEHINDQISVARNEKYYLENESECRKMSLPHELLYLSV